MEKDTFSTQIWLEPKTFYQIKCANYNKSNLEQNSVTGPKDPNSAKKYQKSNIQFQNVPKKCHQKVQNSHFL